VFLLQWVKELLKNKSIDIYFFYDIACMLDTHLRVIFVCMLSLICSKLISYRTVNIFVRMSNVWKIL